VATNVAAGTNLLTVTYGTATNTVQFEYSEWYNISQAAVATALDGTSTASFVSSGNSVPAGAIVTTVDGDLIRQWGENNANTDNSTTFTKGSGFTKVSSQISGTATNFDPTSVSQYQVQGTHGSINPTYTYSGALNTSDTVAIALKSAAAGTAPAAGIRVAGIQQFYALAGVASIKFEMPHVGNLIHISSENENVISGITDGDTNTYQTAAAGADRKLLPSGAFGAESWRAINLTPNTDLVTGLISFTVVLTVNTGFGAIYDIVGADTVQGTGGRVQTVTTNGTQNANGDLATVAITPQNQNALIIAACPIEGMTISGVTIPTSANGGVPDVDPFTGQDGNRGMNNDDGWMHWLNGSSTSAVTITYSTQGAGLPGVGGWAAFATEYKALAASDDKVYSYEDGSMQPVETEEQHEVQGFDISPLSPNFPAQTDQLISYFPDQSEEPDEEWLWPDYWAQAPPESPAITTIEVEDGSLQPVEPEESSEVQDFTADPLSPNAPPAQDLPQQLEVQPVEEDEFAEGFADAPFPALVADQIAPEDASNQLEDEQELEGFVDTPRPVEIDDGPLTSEDSNAQLEEDELLESTHDAPAAVELFGPLPSDDASGQQEEDELIEGFSDAPLAPEIEGPLTSEGSTDDDDELLEGFSDAPLSADFSADAVYVEDASNQSEDSEEQEGFNNDPLSDEFVPDPDYQQPYDDASLQPDELDDADLQDFNSSPLPDDASPEVATAPELGARWPIEVKIYRRKIRKLEREEEKSIKAKPGGKGIPPRIALDEPRVAQAAAAAFVALQDEKGAALEYTDLEAIRAKLALLQSDEEWLLLY